MTFYYPAVVKKTETGYRVDYIDLDQCYGEGPTLEEALADARYNGVTWIQTEQEDTMELPPQTHPEDYQKNLKEGEEITMIALIMPREGWDE